MRTLQLSAGVLLASLLTGSTAAPQTQSDGQGYATLGVAPATFLNISGGGEILILGRIGLGGEIGALVSRQPLLTLLSADASLHFVENRPGEKVVPFVVADRSLAGGGDGGLGAWNLGFGANVWLRPRLGLRIEFRDHVAHLSGEGNVHVWILRAGVGFR